MKLELAETGATPVLGSRLIQIPSRAIDRLARLTGELPGLVVLAALFLLPLAFSPRAESAWTVPKTALLQSLAVLVVAVLLIRLLVGLPVSLRRTPLDIPIAVYLAIVLVGVARSSSLDVAIFGAQGRGNGLLTLLSAVALYYIAYNLPPSSGLLRRAMVAVTLAMTLVSIEGIVEAGGFSLLGFKPDAFGSRAYSTSGNPDFLGGLLVQSWPLAVALMASARGRRKALWSLCLGILLVCLVVTYTRSAWVGSGVGLAVLLLFGQSALWKNWRWSLAIGLTVLLVAGVVGVEAGLLKGTPASQATVQQPTSQAASELKSNPLLSRVENFGEGGDRLMIWQASLGVAQEQPLLGAGYGNLFSAVTRYMPAGWERQYPDTWVDETHNVYLDHLATLGVPGLLAYLALLGSFALMVVRSYRRDASGPRRTMLAALLAAWTGYLAHLFFLFDTPASLAIFWVLMALGLRELDPVRPARSLSLRLPAPVRLAGVLAVLGVAVLAWVGAAQPVVAESYLWQANAAGGLDSPEQSVGFYLKAAEANPHSDLIQGRAAVALMFMADKETDPRNGPHLLDEAVRIWTNALAREPQYAYLYAMRGETYSRYPKTEHAADALADFRQSVALFPTYYVGWAGVADMARTVGRLSEAIGAERRMLEMDPRDQDNMKFLAQDYVRASRWQDAIGTWQKMIDLGGDNADLRLNMAQAYAMAGQKDSALTELDRAQAQAPDNDQVGKVRQWIQGSDTAASSGH